MDLAPHPDAVEMAALVAHYLRNSAEHAGSFQSFVREAEPLLRNCPPDMPSQVCQAYHLLFLRK
jgi:hypothetical protein